MKYRAPLGTVLLLFNVVGIAYFVHVGVFYGDGVVRVMSLISRKGRDSRALIISSAIVTCASRDWVPA